MKNLFKFYCGNKTRPEEFTRSSSVKIQSKVEQSVDFTGGKAPNLELNIQRCKQAKYQNHNK